uniref:Uncharacterized protein n=1 Tax=Tetranychus urticae TaxID=32264 RepID=T1K7M6_TETUR
MIKQINNHFILDTNDYKLSSNFRHDEDYILDLIIKTPSQPAKN